jgi:hypothetical protein
MLKVFYNWSKDMIPSEIVIIEKQVSFIFLYLMWGTGAWSSYTLCMN